MKDSAPSSERLPQTPEWLKDKEENWEEEAKKMEKQIDDMMVAAGQKVQKKA